MIDINLEVRYFKILLRHIQEDKVGNEKTVAIGQLVFHFLREVVKTAEDDNIYFRTLTPNSTHMMQLLDVGVYGHLKKQW